MKNQTSFSDQNYHTSDSISAIRSKIPILLIFADGFHVEQPVPAKKRITNPIWKEILKTIRMYHVYVAIEKKIYFTSYIYLFW